jgi:acetylornithine/N-succinyldiaminopimelate aminotransferase
MSNASLLALREAGTMATYGTPSLALVRGKGSTVWDADGRSYLDLLAGIAVSSLGHAHPALVEAVSHQVSQLAHTSNLYVNEPSARLAKRLVDLLRPAAGDARAFLANSGAEANECALKIARKHGRSLDPGKTHLVAAERSFHGRTTGALALTGQPAKREPFTPLIGDVTFVPYGDVDALAAAVTERTCAVILEPTLGEGGVVPAPPGYLAAARAITRTHEALLVLDEVQGGIGRTGSWFAHSADLPDPADAPDLVTLAKGLGGGLPIGACLGVGSAAEVLVPGDHGSTFGSNPVAAAAANAVLDTIVGDGLLEHVTVLGSHLRSSIEELGHPLLSGVRGKGLWLGLVLSRPVSADVELLCREQGFLVNAAVPEAVRLAPPLVLTREEADLFVAALPAVLNRVGA